MTRKSMKIPSVTSWPYKTKLEFVSRMIALRLYLSDIFVSNMDDYHHFSYVSSCVLFDYPPSAIRILLFPHGLSL